VADRIARSASTGKKELAKWRKGPEAIQGWAGGSLFGWGFGHEKSGGRRAGRAIAP